MNQKDTIPRQWPAAMVNITNRCNSLYPKFIWNRYRALELTLSQNAKAVTDKCCAKELVMPLYLDGDRFTRPFCCMGNDVDCDLCGSWVVFNLAAKIEMNDF